ncbi:hypothetical protein [Chryseosolibacter indicus]|uniref:Uncharacterized protein n=1 Tax=Chryseosolibacter indicus TaxID=2782351 RepID=A0ABS5VWA0_9BACT|nr:hypothetical protein [Chryseosolibacter indicus]MBT1705149.1 hypothetical protein [Chryseosolibacter indicus]
MKNDLKIINEHQKFQKVSLKETTNSFYLLLAAEIDHSLFPFFITTSKKKKYIIREAKEWSGELLKQGIAIDATTFYACLIPPGIGKYLKERQGEVQVAKYDFVILIETSSRQKMEEIQNSDEYKQMVQKITSIATATHFITAVNVKRIDSVDHKSPGVFLFNYFFADDLQQNIGIWEYTAGWFQQETGLDNSTVLLPQGNSNTKYTIINHCRWDNMSDILPSLLFKRTFQTYVLDNFYANKVAAMPILYKKA